MKFTPTVIAINGNPAPLSRTQRLLEHVTGAVRRRSYGATQIDLRTLPAEALLTGDPHDELIAEALKMVRDADAVVIGTPIFKSAFSGLTKLFLDLLPRDGLRGKLVLPIATGSSATHTMALDYCLGPVLNSLGARQVLSPVFAGESQVRWTQERGLELDLEIIERLGGGIDALVDLLPEPVFPLPAATPNLRVLRFDAAQHC